MATPAHAAAIGPDGICAEPGCGRRVRVYHDRPEHMRGRGGTADARRIAAAELERRRQLPPTWAHRRAYRIEGGRRIGYWSCDMYDGAECQGHPRAAA